MKKYLSLLLFVVSLPIEFLNGQNSFDRTENIKVGDIIFIKKTSRYVTGYSNVLNKWINAAYLQFKDGTPLGEHDYDRYDLSSSRESFDQAIRMTFSKKEINELKNNPPAQMTFYYVVSPEGKTLEVAFIIPNESKILIDLPLEKYALLEQNLRKYLKWTVNDFGKQMKFLHAWRIVDFPSMKISYPITTGGTVGNGKATE